MTMTSEQPLQLSSHSEPADQLTADPSASTDDDIGSSTSSSTPPPHAASFPHVHHSHTAQHAIHTTADTLTMTGHFQPQQLHSPHVSQLSSPLSSPFSTGPLSSPFDASDSPFPLTLPPGLDGVMRDLSAMSIASQPPHYPQQQQHQHQQQQQQQQQQQLAILQQYMLQQQHHMQQLAAAAYLYNLHYQHSHSHQQPQHQHTQHSHPAISAAHYALPYSHTAEQHIQHILASQPNYPTVPMQPYLTTSSSAPAAASLSPLSPALSSGSVPLVSTSSLSTPFPRTKLIVRYLPPTLTPTAFHALFQPFGRLLSSNLIMSRSQPQMSLCYGFLLYTTEAEARECRRNMNGRRVEGRVIEVEECKGGKEGRNGEKRVIRITGWKGRPTEADIRLRCEVYGEVESVAVTADETLAATGAGAGEASVIVKFAQSASAYRCIESMHNAHIGEGSGASTGGDGSGAGGNVSVKFHDAAHRGRQSHRLNSASRASRGSGTAGAGAGSGAVTAAGSARARQRSARRAQDEPWLGGAGSVWSMDSSMPAHLHDWSSAAAAVIQQQQGEVDDLPAAAVEGGGAISAQPLESADGTVSL